MNRKLKIYLADDDPDEHDLFETALRTCSHDFRIETFLNGKLLLDFLATPNGELPDLIFLDLNMPVLDGLDTLKILRSIDALQQVKVAVYSTSSNPTDIEHTFLAGASIYIEKPHDFKSLCSTLKHVLANVENITINPETKRDFVFDPIK